MVLSSCYTALVFRIVLLPLYRTGSKDACPLCDCSSPPMRANPLFSSHHLQLHCSVSQLSAAHTHTHTHAIMISVSNTVHCSHSLHQQLAGLVVYRACTVPMFRGSVGATPNFWVASCWNAYCTVLVLFQSLLFNVQ